MKAADKGDFRKQQPRKTSLQRATATATTSDTNTTSELSLDLSGRNKVMTKGGQVLGVLPSKIKSKLPKYIATLTCALYASEEPFGHFSKTSSKFLDLSRKAFDSVYDNLKVLDDGSIFELESDDTLYHIVS
jgi:hypothetical protein